MHVGGVAERAVSGYFPRVLRVGAWRSLVAHLLWEQRVVCSNQTAPTNKIKVLAHKGFLACHLSGSIQEAEARSSPRRSRGILPVEALRQLLMFEQRPNLMRRYNIAPNTVSR
jgi:hypothetical protein